MAVEVENGLFRREAVVQPAGGLGLQQKVRVDIGSHGGSSFDDALALLYRIGKKLQDKTAAFFTIRATFPEKTGPSAPASEKLLIFGPISSIMDLAKIYPPGGYHHAGICERVQHKGKKSSVYAVLRGSNLQTYTKLTPNFFSPIF